MQSMNSVACALPPLAPVSTPSQPGASVGNSEHLWLHWRTCGYSLEKKPGQTCVSPSCWNSPGFLSFYLIIQVYSPQPELQLGGLRLESTNHIKIKHHHNVIPKSLPEKLYCAPIHLNLNQAAETCSDFYDCISYFNAVLVTLTCKAVAGKWICFTRLGPWIMVSHNYWMWSSTLISNSSAFKPLIISLNYFIIRKEIFKRVKKENNSGFSFLHTECGWFIFKKSTMREELHLLLQFEAQDLILSPYEYLNNSCALLFRNSECLLC